MSTGCSVGDRICDEIESGVAGLVQLLHYPRFSAAGVVVMDRAFLRRFVQGDDSFSNGFLSILNVIGFDQRARSLNIGLGSGPQRSVTLCFSDGCSMGFCCWQFLGISLVIRHIFGSADRHNIAVVPSDNTFYHEWEGFHE